MCNVENFVSIMWACVSDCHTILVLKIVKTASSVNKAIAWLNNCYMTPDIFY